MGRFIFKSKSKQKREYKKNKYSSPSEANARNINSSIIVCGGAIASEWSLEYLHALGLTVCGNDHSESRDHEHLPICKKYSTFFHWIRKEYQVHAFSA